MNTLPSLQPTDFLVLIADDDADDRVLLAEALQNDCLHARVEQVENGEELMARLQSREPRPDLILLDLNMPLMCGREVLAVLKSDARWRAIPVVVLTTSSAIEDIELSQRLGVSAFITKPASVNDFDRLVHTLRCRWLDRVEFPSAA